MRAPHSQLAGFTLLEAILALSVLAAVLIVTLDMQAQSLTGARRIAAHTRDHRHTQAIIDAFDAGTLATPSVDPQTDARTWTGQHLGAPFTLTATPIMVPNPVPSRPGAPRAEQVRMFRYELTYLGSTTRFLDAR